MPVYVCIFYEFPNGKIKHRTLGISAMEGQRCNWPHGRGLGGSSLINYLIYTRGNRRDFDRIAAAGNPGWNFDSILPLYQKFERSMVEPMDDTDSFGKTGLLQIEEARFR